MSLVAILHQLAPPQHKISLSGALVYAIASGSHECLRTCLPDCSSRCSPVWTEEEKQIGDVTSSWVKNWNDGQLANVVDLYAPHADLLAADGSRASGQDQIRASLEKQLGSKVEVQSLAFACSGAFAYNNGTYKQTVNGQSVEGNYLVVFFWKEGEC